MMDDRRRDLEALLRSYRPVGPAADLRARILAPASARRVWPWAAAAAALLALTIGLHESAAHATRLRATDADTLRSDPYSALREVASDDEIVMMDMMTALHPPHTERAQESLWP